jgi:hypothetical protein
MSSRTLSLIVAGALASCALSAQAPVKTRIPTPSDRAAGLGGTRVAGTMECGKPSRNAVEVGDEPNHMLAVGKSACTWSKPMTLGGAATKDGSSSVLADVRGDAAADHGYHVGTVAGGDKFFVRFDGKSESSQGVLKSQSGRWGFVGGTGKLKDLKGRGYYKSTPKPDGSTTVEIEGEYRLP